jgi:hypothetical protein
MNSNTSLRWVFAFFILSLSLQAPAAHSDDTSEDVLDDGALDSLEMELHASCGSQRGGDAKLYLSSQILDRTEKLNLVLKRKFMAIHNYFRNPYEVASPAPLMHIRDDLQFEVENLERLERQGQSYENIEKQRSKVKMIKAELDRKMSAQRTTRFISSERMAHATSEMKQLGKWADRLDLVQKKAEGCYGFANDFKKSPSDLASGSGSGDASGGNSRSRAAQ